MAGKKGAGSDGSKQGMSASGGGGGGEAGGSSGNDTTFKPRRFKVSRISIHPSRKIGLKNYSSVEVSAGFEMVFDSPVDIDDPVITEAFAAVHEKLQVEFRNQLNDFGAKKKE